MKQAIIGIGIMFFGLLGMGLVQSTPVSAACNERFLTFPAWYRGINDKSNNCNIKMPSGKDGLAKFIWTIVLNLVEIMIQVVAYISIGYIMWGGYTYMRSMGSPENIKRAKDMIQNAIIGLMLSIVSIIAVSFVIGRIATV